MRWMPPEKSEILRLCISLLIVVVSILDAVGRKANLPNMLTLALGSLGTGISLGRFLERQKTAAGEKGAVPAAKRT